MESNPPAPAEAPGQVPEEEIPPVSPPAPPAPVDPRAPTEPFGVPHGDRI